MERVTYRATLSQAARWWGVLACLAVGPQLLPPVGWGRDVVVLVTGILVVGALLLLNLGLRIDDRGVTVLRGVFRKRVPWDEVVRVEESYAGTGRRFLVVITTRTVHPVTFPMDGRLLRDDAFGRKTRHVQDLVARELQRRAPADAAP